MASIFVDTAVNGAFQLVGAKTNQVMTKVHQAMNRIISDIGDGELDDEEGEAYAHLCAAFTIGYLIEDISGIDDGAGDDDRHRQ